jgi:hypothetical protein
MHHANFRALWLALALTSPAAFAQRKVGDLSYLDLLKEGYRLTSVEIARFENSLLTNPADLSTRARLISYYFQHAISQPRLAHIFWVIANRPESKLAGSPVAVIDILNTRGDYEKASKIWLTQIDAYTKNADVLTNAAAFFEAEEPTRAEGLLKRAWHLERDNKMRLAALSNFYSRILSACEFQVEKAVPRPCPDPAWLNQLKSELESSREAQLILGVAERLLQIGQIPDLKGTWKDPGFRGPAHAARPRTAGAITERLSHRHLFLRKLQVGEIFNLARTVADLLRTYARHIEHAEKKVRHRRAFFVTNMTAAFDFVSGATREQCWQVMMLVTVAVADAAAVYDQGVVQKRAFAVLSRLHLLQEVTEHLNVMLVDFLKPLDLGRIIEMMREPMVCIRHTDRAISPVAAFAADHETDYTRQVRLKSDSH